MEKLALNIDDDGGCLSTLSDKGKRLGYLEYEEIVECLKYKGIIEKEEIDDIVQMIVDMGIEVHGKSG